MSNADTHGRHKTKRETVHEAIGLVQRLSDIFQKRRTVLAGEVGLTEKQWLVLERISDEHFMPSMFAKEQASSPAAVSKIVRQLIDKGVISVSFNDADARHREYQLTAAGKKTMSRLRALREAAIDQIWMAQDEEALERFCDFSTQLIASIETFSRKEV
jgi:DNA-binding MarR family transcriptional regulator